MGEAASKINDIKPIENFSYKGCYYSKAEDGSVSRSCDELRERIDEEMDAKLKAGKDPEVVEKKKAKMYANITEIEADKDDALIQYNEVVGVQTAVINFFAKNIDSIRDADVISGDKAKCFPNEICSKIILDDYVVTFTDYDADGTLGGVSINLNYDDVMFGYTQEKYFIGYLMSIGFPNAHTSKYKTWLRGEDFAPLFSALMALSN